MVAPSERADMPQPTSPSEVAAPSQTSTSDETAAAQTSEKARGKGKEKPAPKAADAQPDGEAKLSGKELKERAKREKAERRAKEKADKTTGPPPPPPTAGPAGAKGAKGAHADASKQQWSGDQVQQNGQPQRRRAPSQAASTHVLPVRGSKQTQGGPVKEPRRATKEVGLFGHLYTQPKKYTIENVSKEVHPAVLALGLQMSSYVICGSNARCVAMLLAFKKVLLSPH